MAVLRTVVIRKRGRPRVADGPTVTVWTRVPTEVHEHLSRLAARRQQSLHQVVREVLVRAASCVSR